MGISSAPEIFQRKMSKLLGKHEGCEVITDDIIIYGKTHKEHDEHLAAAENHQRIWAKVKQREMSVP